MAYSMAFIPVSGGVFDVLGRFVMAIHFIRIHFAADSDVDHNPCELGSLLLPGRCRWDGRGR